MNFLKRIVGILCMIAGPVVVAVLVIGAIQNIDLTGKSDIQKPVPWIIIIAVFTPIMIGLMIFGWYAWKGEYRRLPERSEEL
jgi:purine-cytosine permease-like protein